jgi:hypothetical protein
MVVIQPAVRLIIFFWPLGDGKTWVIFSLWADPRPLVFVFSEICTSNVCFWTKNICLLFMAQEKSKKAAIIIFSLNSSQYLSGCSSQVERLLKVQCHKFFEIRFLSWIICPENREYRSVFRIFSKNKRRYSRLKVWFGCYVDCRWQIYRRTWAGQM